MTAVTRVVIVGGGTAGWMAAAAFVKAFGRRVSVDLVESETIGTVGVGEATIPPIRNFHRLLELDEADFLRAVDGTCKLGIEFENWGGIGERYFHPFSAFGVDAWAAQFHHYWRRARDAGESAALDAFSLEAAMARDGRFGQEGDRKAAYAYHFDAGRYAALLRRLAEAQGARRTEGKVVDVRLAAASGHIEAVLLESGEQMAGDLFIDCSGFRALLIGKSLGIGWEDWSAWLRCDRALAVQTELTAPPSPFTRATARSAGWQWKIPLQSRVGNGLVYSSAYLDDDRAEKTLRDNLDGTAINELRQIRFAAGRRAVQWEKNCLALGLSSGFLEPLESTSIHLIQNGIIRFIKLFPSGGIESAEIDQFNREAQTELERIRDFIICHYHVTNRDDSAFWRDCRTMPVPDTLAHKLELFRTGGKIFRDDNELFSETSWVAVMIGQGLLPARYHPFADGLSADELSGLMSQVRGTISRLVQRQPLHRDYLAAAGGRVE